MFDTIKDMCTADNLKKLTIGLGIATGISLLMDITSEDEPEIQPEEVIDPLAGVHTSAEL